MPATVVANPPLPRAKRKRRAAKSAAGKSWLTARQEKVARARKLLSDPDYPSPKVLDSVARLLGKHLLPGDRKRQHLA